MKAIMTLVLAAALSATAEKKPKAAPTIYDNTRTISASCDAVWPRVVSTVARFWFAPD